MTNETTVKVHYRPNRKSEPPKRTGHTRYSFTELKKYYLIVLGNKCCICGSIHNLELHHIKGLLASPLRGATVKRKRIRATWNFYFYELEISLKNDNLEIRCKHHHNSGKLHNHLYDNQTTLTNYGVL